MTGPRRKYDAAFREEAVQLVLSSDRSVKQVADELGVNESTLGELAPPVPWPIPGQCGCPGSGAGPGVVG